MIINSFGVYGYANEGDVTCDTLIDDSMKPSMVETKVSTAFTNQMIEKPQTNEELANFLNKEENLECQMKV